jgi:hypothetical protein
MNFVGALAQNININININIKESFANLSSLVVCYQTLEFTLSTARFGLL